ncbi:MAG: bifunctional precorrin-2 dehydrogenase/sirohydrochlorin ferrochelatase [Treponema sp.]|jgi:siroheme synthase-like protein|nr:bifunctional precorrin-2 dehydrogenase/sirohydrochlorin ferrochelatase [Treponema sp.]
MPHFPLFIDLHDLPCLVAGGGAVAVRKIETLLEFGARVTALDPLPSEALEKLSRNGYLSLLRRFYAGPEDLKGAKIVIAATGDREANHRVSQDAQVRGIPVNVADDPEACTFFFPAIVRRGDLVAGISTSGTCPRFCARLRERLEKEWPPGWGEALKTLGAERRRLRAAEGSEKTLPLLDKMISRIFGEENSP